MARWRWAAALAFFVVVAGAESLRLGLDANWDLKNYHFYNPHAFVTGRIGSDIAPAMAQTYHNPLADLPFYFMVREGVPPRVISFVMAIPAAIAACFLLSIALVLFPKARHEDRGTWVALAVAIGVLGAAGHAVIGSTMGEWPPAALTIAAISILVSSTARNGAPSTGALLAAGALAGIAAGLKLTYGPVAAALWLAMLAFGSLGERVRRALVLGASVFAGFLVSYGFWGLILYREFANPFFPYFNAIFASPWWEPRNFFDHTYGPQDALQAIFFPFFFAWKSSLVGEVGFRDGRFAVLYAFAAACGVKWLLQRRSVRAAARADDGVARAWRLVAVFALAAYLAWLALFGIFRYLVPVEMLTGPLIVGAGLYLVHGQRRRQYTVGILGLLVIASAKHGNWNHLAYAQRYFEVSVPAVEPHALVIVGPYDPMAYAVPFFPADARFVSPLNNLIAPGQSNLLTRRIAEAVDAHTGPLYLMEMSGGIDGFLARHRLARDAARCAPIRSNIDFDAIRLCRLARQAG